MGGGGMVGALVGLTELLGDELLDLLAADELSDYLYLIGNAIETGGAEELGGGLVGLGIALILTLLAKLGIGHVTDGAMLEMNNAYAQGRAPKLYRTGDVIFAGSGNTQVYRIKDV